MDPGLAQEFGPSLIDALKFFDEVRSEMGTKLLHAISQVVGDPNMVHDSMVNYRMVDYPERETIENRDSESHGPRCGGHRDFGTLTIIFPETSGFEVLLDGETENWKRVQLSKKNSALLVFGWCTTIRSNDRVPAALHRVGDSDPDENGIVPRRISAVFFIAPSAKTPLNPTVLPNEKKIYGNYTAGDLKNVIGRKWRYREGTLEKNDEEQEKEEQERFPTQDAIVNHLFKMH